MRKWLHDNPWIWVVVFLALLVGSSLVVLVIAQLNRPVIVKEDPSVVSQVRNGPAESPLFPYDSPRTRT